MNKGLLFSPSVVAKPGGCHTHSEKDKKIPCFVDIQSLMHILIFLYSSFKIRKLFTCKNGTSFPTLEHFLQKNICGELSRFRHLPFTHCTDGDSAFMKKENISKTGHSYPVRCILSFCSILTLPIFSKWKPFKLLFLCLFPVLMTEPRDWGCSANARPLS